MCLKVWWITRNKRLFCNYRFSIAQITGESPIDVRRLIDVTSEPPSSGRQINNTVEPPCILW